MSYTGLPIGAISTGAIGATGSTGMTGATGASSTIVSAQYYLNARYLTTTATPVILSYDYADVASPAIGYTAGTFTINNTGIYTFVASTTFATNGTGNRYGYFQQNGAASQFGLTIVPAITTDATGYQTTFTWSLAAGTTITYTVEQTSGGNVYLLGFGTTATQYCQMSITGTYS